MEQVDGENLSKKAGVLELVFGYTGPKIFTVRQGEVFDAAAASCGEKDIIRAWYGAPQSQWQVGKGKGKIVTDDVKKLVKAKKDAVAEGKLHGPGQPRPTEQNVLLVEVNWQGDVAFKFVAKPVSICFVKNKTPLVTSKPLKGTTAEAAGIKQNMTLKSVNGQDVQSMRYQEALDLFNEKQDKLLPAFKTVQKADDAEPLL